jgi:hypothetical protein
MKKGISNWGLWLKINTESENVAWVSIALFAATAMVWVALQARIGA